VIGHKSFSTSNLKKLLILSNTPQNNTTDNIPRNSKDFEIGTNRLQQSPKDLSDKKNLDPPKNKKKKKMNKNKDKIPKLEYKEEKSKKDKLVLFKLKKKIDQKGLLKEKKSKQNDFLKLSNENVEVSDPFNVENDLPPEFVALIEKGGFSMKEIEENTDTVANIFEIHSQYELEIKKRTNSSTCN